MAISVSQNQGMSEDTKTIITVLLLVFVFPIGIILMWFWVKWSLWVKLLITIPLLILPIIAILAAVLVINPIELTKTSRDAARLSDFASLQQAIDVAVQEAPNLNAAAAVLCNGSNLAPCVGSSISDTRVSEGTGWVKINLKQQQSVSIPVLPVDPVNDKNYKYIYCAKGNDWELVTVLESKQQQSIMATDGGIDPAKYEVGNNFNLLNSIPGCTY